MTDLPGVVFLHIPKAAGVSVNNILMTLYPKDSQFWYTRHSWDSYEESPKIRYIHGHFDFETAKTFATDRRLITFVRDPVARMLSEFYYWKSHTEWFVERDNLDAARVVQDLSVRDFLESGHSDAARSEFELQHEAARRLRCVASQPRASG